MVLRECNIYYRFSTPFVFFAPRFKKICENFAILVWQVFWESSGGTACLGFHSPLVFNDFFISLLLPFKFTLTFPFFLASQASLHPDVAFFPNLVTMCYG